MPENRASVCFLNSSLDKRDARPLDQKCTTWRKRETTSVDILIINPPSFSDLQIEGVLLQEI